MMFSGLSIVLTAVTEHSPLKHKTLLGLNSLLRCGTLEETWGKSQAPWDLQEFTERILKFNLLPLNVLCDSGSRDRASGAPCGLISPG